MKKPPLLPGAILMGAQSRLLPPFLPFLFLAAAVIFHIAAWVALAWAAAEVPDYVGGPGPVLAAVHILTLGVLVMTAVGAALQLLPVATGLAHRSIFPAKTIWWLYSPALLILIVGFVTAEPMVMMVGAVPASLALIVFFSLIVDMIRRATTLGLTVAFVWFAMLSLLGLVALGLGLIADFEHAFLPDHQMMAALHMTLGAYGFMGMLVLGISGILVPMFSLSPGPPATVGWASLALAGLALTVVLGAMAIGLPAGVVAGVGIGLAGVALHLRNMFWSLAHGMRKNLGLSFVMIKLAWVMLPLGLVLGGVLALDWLGRNGPALFGFVLLYGWLLTFLMGVLQRIIPFLATMNMSERGRKPPRLSELAEGWMLKAHVACHAAALAVVAVGIVLDWPLLVRLGALSGMAGAVCFAWFGATVVRRYLAYHRGSLPSFSPTPETSSDTTGPAK